MDENLAAHLARNEQMWEVWRTFGITEQTSLPVDFQFYSAKRDTTERLTDALRRNGFTVTTESTRTLLFLRGWRITATETGYWTLQRLQDRTRELFEMAEALDIGLEGVGAMMPDQPK